MSRRHNRIYSDASTHQAGEMICTVCRKEITEGQFRYRETEQAYISQHRACSEDDPHWAALDKRRADWASFAAARREAAEAFIEKWGITDLTDILEPVQ